MDQTIVFLTIVGMLLVTYLPRVLPIWILSSKSLPPVVVAWLRHVPCAVLAAMLLPALLIQDKQLNYSSANLFFWAAWPTLFVVLKTRSFFGAVLVGMGSVALARHLF